MNPYFEQMILSASPIELVRLMYQRAVACVADAREHLRAGRIIERGQAIAKAYAIISELMASLDREKAPELATNLRRLYPYLQQRLVEANLRQTDAPLAEVSRLLTTLADAWQAATPANAPVKTMAGATVDNYHGAEIAGAVVFA